MTPTTVPDTISKGTISRLPSALAHRLRVVPVREGDGKLFLVADHRLGQAEITELEFRLNDEVAQEEPISKDAIDRLLRTYYPSEEAHRAVAYLGIDALADDERSTDVILMEEDPSMTTTTTTSITGTSRLQPKETARGPLSTI